MAILEEKMVYNGPELGFSYSTLWTCENATRLPLPSGSQTSTAKFPIYTFHSNEVEVSDLIKVSVMGDGKESSATNPHNSFGLMLLFSVFYSV